MSHKTGKIEILATYNSHTYMKYHHTDNKNNNEKFMVFNNNPDAKWLEDFGAPISESTPEYQMQFNYLCTIHARFR